MEQSEDRLVITISNSQPVELKDLARAFNAIAEQYSRFSMREGKALKPSNARLSVKEIRQGSIVAELYDFAAANAIPFMEHTGAVLAFGDYLKKGFDYLRGNSTDTPPMDSVDYKDFSQIVSPIAKDEASQMNISTTINGVVNITVNITSPEAQAVQGAAKMKRRDLLDPLEDDVQTSVIMYWYQTRDGGESDGDKAVIEDISPDPMNVTWSDPQLKTAMMKNEHENPNLTAYVVDAKPQTVQGRIVAYKVIRLIDSFPKEG